MPVEIEQKEVHFLLRILLKPLARFCRRHALHYQDLAHAAKLAFIDIAEEELTQKNIKVNLSRVSVMTGLHRPDLMRLMGKVPAAPREEKNFLSRLIAQWRYDPHFCSKPDQPRTLTCDSPGSEFFKLVECLTTSLHPGTIQFELERQGHAKRTPRGLKLLMRLESTLGDKKRSYELLAKDMETLFCGIDENISGAPQGYNLHIRTEYDNIYVRDVPKIKRWLMAQGKAFHKRARAYLAQHDKDVNPSRSEKAAGTKVSLTAVSHVVLPSTDVSD